MALLRRYGFYVAIAICLVFFLYSLEAPYEGSPLPTKTKSQSAKPTPSYAYKPFKWEKVSFRNKIDKLHPLPTGTPKELPRIQFAFKEEDSTTRKIREARKEEVRKQFFKCWRSYRSHAWMHDEVRPISGKPADPFGGWGATLIDALDTLHIMGFTEEFSSAIADVESINFGYTNQELVNVFETNIRYLGGLLSAHELSGDQRLLNKAKEVGEMLYHAFDTPNNMPITRWNFTAKGHGKAQVADNNVLLAEIGSLTMEFTRLSQLTKDPKWFDAVMRITWVLDEQQEKTALPGMWPLVVNAREKDFTKHNSFTLNSMADSTYEYFGKMYALLGGQDAIFRKLYEKSMDAAIKSTIFRPSTPDESDLLVSGSVTVDGSTPFLDPVLQHLSCYTGGMFALGGRLFQKQEHVNIGRKLTDGCVWAYKTSPAGIMPEVSHLLQCQNTSSCKWDEIAWHNEVSRKSDNKKEKDPLKNIANLRLPEGFTAIDDRRYILRPEAIESVFIMYRITGEQQWQAAAWDMWTAIQRSTDTDLGNSALIDISADTPPRDDSMEVSASPISVPSSLLHFPPPPFEHVRHLRFISQVNLILTRC